MTQAPRDNDSTRHDTVHDLVMQCLSHIEAGRNEEIDELLEQHPHAAESVRRQLARLENVGFLAPYCDQDRPPDKLGPFRIREKIGGGGMGIVYSAEQEPLGREVALKVIRPDQLFFEGSRKRFRREVEAIARLKHPGIVPIYTVGEEGDIPYYAMERVDGCTLMEALQDLGQHHPDQLSGMDLLQVIHNHCDAPLPPPSSTPALFRGDWVDTCFRVAEQVVSALEHAHGSGILHRDIKPSNLMMTKDGRVLLLDFGLASTAGSGEITRSGSQLGSLLYMAPEQVLGQTKEIDERTDIYQLGVTLFELLSLRRPFQSDSTEATRSRILAGQVSSLREAHSRVPWDAETVCLAAMERDPARRYADAAAFLADIRNVLGRRPITARRPSLALRAKRFTQRHPAWSIGLAAGVLLLAGALISLGTVLAINRDLVQANRDTTSALNRESEARALAEGEAKRAKTNYRQALEATEKMLTQVGFRTLRPIPGVNEVRKALLRDAEAFYVELLNDRPDDNDTKFYMAKNYRLLGQIRHDLGDDEKAIEALDQALMLLEPIVDEDPHVDYRQELSAILAKTGDIYESQGDLASPRDYYLRSIALDQEVIEAITASPEHVGDLPTIRLNLGRNLQAYGTYLFEAGEVEEAESQLKRALALFDETKDRASSLDTELFVCATLSTIGSIQQESGKRRESESHLRRAIDRGKKLCEAHPTNPRCSEWLAGAQSTLSMLLAGENNQEAYDIAAESLERLRSVSNQFDDVILYRQLLLNTIHQQGLMCHRLLKLEEAEALLREGLTLAADLRERVPRPDYAIMELSVAVSLAYFLEKSNKLEDADAIYARATQIQEEIAEQWPDFGESANQQPRPWLGHAVVARRTGDFEEAHRRIDRALEISSRNNSEHEVAQRVHFQVLEEMANLALAEGQHADVYEVCLEFVDAELAWEGYRYNAGLMARCIDIVRQDVDLSEEEREASELEYRDVALALLRQAIHWGYRNAAEMRGAPDFSTLHEDSEFLEILEDTSRQ